MARINPAPTQIRTTRLSHALLASLAGALLSLTLVPAVTADEQDEAYIEYRESVMEIIGTHMGAVADIMKNGLDVPGAIAGHAQQMAEAAALIAPAFKRPITEGPTDAKPEIWSDWARFERAIEDYEKAARGLAAAATSADPASVGPAMKALGKSCGGCHKPFRKPKEESYKNK
jgi:cytochrome c556